MSQKKRKNKKEQNTKERIQKKENKDRATIEVNHIKITNTIMLPPVTVCYLYILLYF